VLTVPTGVVQQGPSGFFAFVVDNKGTVQKRQLKVGFSDQSTTVIQDGLKDGETVVTEGQYRIKAGSEVSIQNFTSMN
jgi:multidrug efflux system membrane fusion protein